MKTSMLRYMIMFFSIAVTCFAQEYTDEVQQVGDGLRCVYSSLGIYRDPSGIMDLTQIRALASSKWSPLREGQMENLGYTRDAVWVHVRLRSERDTAFPCFIELGSTRINSIQWYVMDGFHVIKRTASGSAIEHQNDLPDLRRPSIDINLPAYDTRDI